MSPAIHVPLVLLLLTQGCARDEGDLKVNPILLHMECDVPPKRSCIVAETAKVYAPGQYCVYRVTQWGSHDVPLDATVVASFALQPDDIVRFSWADGSGGWWSGYKGTDQLASVQGHEIHLGKATVRTRYYWAFDKYWAEYWKAKPGLDNGKMLIGLLSIGAGGRAQ